MIFKNENDKLLYLNNYKKKSFQWELWPFCNNKCSFCYLGTTNKETQIKRQLTSLNDLNKILDNFDYKTYNNISLIGGEFFQGQLRTDEIKNLFFEIITKIGKLYKEKKIGSSWIATTMTIGQQEDLYEVLEYYKQNNMFRPVNGYGSSGLWLCTSWDAKGRFHTNKMKKNWEHHITNINKLYPWVKWTTTIILTGPLMRMVLNNELDFHKFSNDFHTTLFFKQPGLGTNHHITRFGFSFDNPTKESYDEAHFKAKQQANKDLGFDFFPSKELAKEFMLKMNKDYFEFYDRLFNINYRADELHRNFNEMEHDRKDTRFKGSATETDELDACLNKCNHLFNYACFIEDNSCIQCLKKEIYDKHLYDKEIEIKEFKKNDLFILNKIRRDCKVIAREMSKDDKILFLKNIINNCSYCINDSIVINISFLINMPELKIFNDKYCWFKSISELIDIKANLKKECQNLKKEIISIHIGLIKNDGCTNKEQNLFINPFWRILYSFVEDKIPNIFLSYNGDLKVKDIQPAKFK